MEQKNSGSTEPGWGTGAVAFLVSVHVQMGGPIAVPEKLHATSCIQVHHELLQQPETEIQPNYTPGMFRGLPPPHNQSQTFGCWIVDDVLSTYP